jgi:hypothetical protein
VGPHFEQADRRVGRHRLPQGYVAVLDDDERLRQVILELHAYAMAGPREGQRRLGVLFRQAVAGDREGIANKLIEHFGASSLLENSAVYGVDERYHFVFDSESVAHVWNRHSDPVAEPQHGQVPLERGDLGRIPAALRPRNIVEFGLTKGMPRIVYEESVADGTMVVVGEVQHGRQWVVVRTAYKRK